MTFVHALATVDPTARLGVGCNVWQGASVIRNAVLGDDCNVGGCAIVDGARVGDRARFGHGAQAHPGFLAGNDLFVGPGAIICNDLWPWLGDQDFDLAALLSGSRYSVIAEDGVTIGAGALIMPGTRLCAGSMVAAGAVAQWGVPENHLLHRDGACRPIKRGERSKGRMLWAA